MRLAFDLAHGDAIVRELEGWIRGTGAMIDRPVIEGLGDFGNGKRIHELRQRTGIERGPELGWGRAMGTYSLGQSESRTQDSAVSKKCSAGQGHFLVFLLPLFSFIAQEARRKNSKTGMRTF
jgi:hypothetical protein